MVIDCWLSLRRFWPPGRRALKRLAADHPDVLEAHFGERDKVIPPRNARRLDGVCPVHFHPCGHGFSARDRETHRCPIFEFLMDALHTPLSPVDFRPRSRPRIRP